MTTTKIIYPFGTTFLDYPDNSSQAVIIYFLGCEWDCKDCHNPLFKIRDNDKAKEVGIKQFYNDLLIFCKKQNNTTKIIFSGGDPLHPLNRQFVREFLNKYSYLFDICIYTGYPIEQIKLMDVKGFTFIKSGTYDSLQAQEPYKSDNFMRFASMNQQLYDENLNLVSRQGKYYFTK
jgi:organic radical activating enzyme